jgi:uncharacterized paraquat-inducible protein A
LFIKQEKRRIINKYLGVKVMKLKYKTDCDGFIFTFCPNIEKEGIKVGSRSCSLCEYFVSDDAEKKIVECSFKGNK